MIDINTLPKAKILIMKYSVHKTVQYWIHIQTNKNKDIGIDLTARGTSIDIDSIEDLGKEELQKTFINRLSSGWITIDSKNKTIENIWNRFLIILNAANAHNVKTGFMRDCVKIFIRYVEFNIIDIKKDFDTLNKAFQVNVLGKWNNHK